MKNTIFLRSMFAIATLSFAMTSTAVLSEVVSKTEKFTSKQVQVPNTFGSSRIRDFRVVDEDTIIFDVFGYGELVAKVFPGCHNLEFARRVAVRDRGFELSRGATLILPQHNERCTITSLTRFSDSEAPETDAVKS